MLNPIKLYVKSQEIQLNWIRNHPVQYIAINVIPIVALLGYYQFKDRQYWRKHDEALKPVETPQTV